MENITADLIVEVYAKYQLLTYWYHLGIWGAIIFGFLGFVILGFGATEHEIVPKIIGTLFLMVFILSLITATYYNYQINVVLKPEIARHIVPIGLDVAEKVSKEILDMYNILKRLVNK